MEAEQENTTYHFLPKRKNGGFVLPDGGEVFTDFDVEGGAAEIRVIQTGGPG